MHASGFIWPIVDLRAKYVRSAQLGQKLKVRAQIVEWEYRLKIEYLIRDAMTDQVLTRAHTIQVAVDLATNEMCLVSPSILSQRLGIAG
jgi:acyl-CoA thioester hydrolase